MLLSPPAGAGWLSFSQASPHGVVCPKTETGHGAGILKIATLEHDQPIKGELYSLDRLKEYALFLARQLVVSPHLIQSNRYEPSLLVRMRENGKTLFGFYRALSAAIQNKEQITPAAEWLTDNFHIIEDQLREIRKDLPAAFYNELPQLNEGELKGYPRIYAIALALIAHTDSKIEPETIRRFIDAYQTVSPLNTGELWALAITLRIGLVENLTRLSRKIVLDHKKQNLANQRADAFFSANSEHHDMKALTETLLAGWDDPLDTNHAFLAQLAKRLRDQDTQHWPALNAVEEEFTALNLIPENAINSLHQSQASKQLSVANIITSMRLLSALNWREFFENVSLVEKILGRDTFYRDMDFRTRDQYRHVVERISKRINVKETVIANQAWVFTQLAKGSKAHQASKQLHIGYYLIGEGRSSLESYFKYREGFNFERMLLGNPKKAYFGSILLFFALISVLPLWYLAHLEAQLLPSLLLLSVLWVPMSEFAIQCTNLALNHFIRPRILPKMELKMGIPSSARTMVVIPTLLISPLYVQQLLGKIEVSYLGNSDPELYFALLTDHTDANAALTENDASLMSQISDGIHALNVKYMKGHISDETKKRFFHFHRSRKWCSTENIWMGWERKRGKLHEFNLLLNGSKVTSFNPVQASDEFLSSIKLVITLDSDTQLPRGTARKLVGASLHPLNAPEYDPRFERVTGGYGILQPRIGVSLESSQKSYFSKIYSGFSGIDPYTTTVSDTYQDLFGEGNYTGKGLYHREAFEAALEKKVPENSLLSHDLFEGLYTRTGLLSDIELLDDFPETYQEYCSRAHRWVRGDWQIASWIFGNRSVTHLPLISRWKIFDNLRRSLVAPFLMLSFVLGWSILPGSQALWSLGIFLLILGPLVARYLVLGLKRMLVLATAKNEVSAQPNFTPSTLGVELSQSALYLIFLPHQAILQMDAIIRSIYRVSFSKKKLLEWKTIAQLNSGSESAPKGYWQSPFCTEILLISLLFFYFLKSPTPLGIPVLITLLWMSYPGVAYFLSKRRLSSGPAYDPRNNELMRMIARRTWNYFHTFVPETGNGLPPDNFQENPTAILANRTSPTNIGLYLVSLVSAYDLGYINAAHLLKAIAKTLDTLTKLEKFRGHYLNWYDTVSLQALHPKYVSTVDSGNLSGFLMTTRQACLQLGRHPVIHQNLALSISDTLKLLEQEILKSESTESPLELREEVTHIRDQLIGLQGSSQTLNHLGELFLKLKKLEEYCLSVALSLFQDVAQLIRQDLENLEGLLSELHQIFCWNEDQIQALPEKIQSSLRLIHPHMSYDEISVALKTSIQLLQLEPKPHGILDALENSLSSIEDFCSHSRSLAQKIQLEVEAMDFTFLMDPERKVFFIGYDTGLKKYDSGLYDLLASESRLASFCAIAKDDVPQEHWFRLNRQVIQTGSGPALVSWSASMFEYLMPTLLMRSYENTLLSETYQNVVRRQIAYGLQTHVPWGISEAGFNARDLQLNYQYGPFGVPGLGLKWGLSHDLVVSPYSTFLAAFIDPEAAITNIKRFIKMGILTQYGFYESIDYTPDRVPPGEKSALIRSHMTHHQGMILVAINNLLHENIMQDRFHSDPSVQATKLLLQERAPARTAIEDQKIADVENEIIARLPSPHLARVFTDPNLPNPRIQLLSNRDYSLMISSAGGGYSKCGDSAVTRWSEDGTQDGLGSYLYIRDLTSDLDSAQVWSNTYQPLGVLPETYRATFSEEKVEFFRVDGKISTQTEIIVTPEDNVEIRLLTLSNESLFAVTLEITSYLEPVLGSIDADQNHPAFSKLFLESEFLKSRNTLLAHRRKRSLNDPENWGLHGVVTDGPYLDGVEFETNRSNFIGRGRTLRNPKALECGQRLGNPAGLTTDTIFSLRIKISVPASGSRCVAFTTGFARSRGEALDLADQYHDIHAFDRESNRAWVKAQVDMRHLNIDTASAQLYQRIAERILFSETSLRPSARHRATQTNIRSSIWPNGISGDLPIVSVCISDQKDLPTVRHLLRCHEYLRLKGLTYDLVIINQKTGSYFLELHEEINQTLRNSGSYRWLNLHGGVFIIRADITPEKDIAHIQAVARVSLYADEPLKDQLVRSIQVDSNPDPFVAVSEVLEYPKPQKNRKQLAFFNGLGGFHESAREYVILLEKNLSTPAPWINVISNAQEFGFQVSEAGSGFTWSKNSQTNRLTPWSNDPVSDTPGEIIYIRDEDTGVFWNPTPSPIGGDESCEIRHGMGYSVFHKTTQGIDQQLSLFVPESEPIKIFLLKLENLTTQTRRLSVTGYVEWVLGTIKSKTAPFLNCYLDTESRAIFASNPHDDEFYARSAFFDLSLPERTFSFSRREFIGRNGDLRSPAALSRRCLSSKRGTDQDPCAAIQTKISIKPGQSVELSFSLGQTGDPKTSRDLALKYRNLETVHVALESVKKYWINKTTRLQLETPNLAMNILMNQWLMYQTLSCRFWARSAFYQSGGAFGFRDQLQDCMAFVYCDPLLTRAHILSAARRQFKEGDVQHWWHPNSGQGIRTHMSDDLLWLPYVVSFYVNKTGDHSILSEPLPFLDAPLLTSEEDSFSSPPITQETATLYEHCLRSIRHADPTGAHGLPLMGTGDWNDGMNRVGHLGKGESVWLGWFLFKVVTDFTELCASPQDRITLEQKTTQLKAALDKSAWDGNWYLRAYFDDGSPLGSASNAECRIDSVAQSWAVLSRAGDDTKNRASMKKVEELLIDPDLKLALLFTPPFNQSSMDPGYVKGYLPGVRENGGQYTHAAIWLMMAAAELRDVRLTQKLCDLLNPIYRTTSLAECQRYRLEPYVLAGDIYSGGELAGQGGWSWYTGSSAWLYRAYLENVLGFKLEGNQLSLNPCIPKEWDQYTITYQFGKSTYLICLKNPNHLSHGRVLLKVDGAKEQQTFIRLVDDTQKHNVAAILEP